MSSTDTALSPRPTGTAADRLTISPQPGKQEAFLSSSADIAFYGGAAGGGKTWSLLLEPIYHYQVPDFGAVIFRRTYPEIVDKGGMWEESAKLYAHLGGQPNESSVEWTFTLETGYSTIKFAHCQHNKDVLARKGAQIPLIEFDQVETFSEYQFWYLFSRNRSMCGVKPYMRATCNPVPSDDAVGGWVHRLIAWWLDCDCTYCRSLPPSESGYLTGSGTPREDRSGLVRWFVRVGEHLVWADEPAALLERYPDLVPKSFTFIPSKLSDNQKLMQADPGYLGNLLALPYVEQQRLLFGNWKVRPTAGKVFNRAWFTLVEAVPAQLRLVRYWDKAGTAEEENPAAAFSAGVKMGHDAATGIFYVLHAVRGQWNAGEREQVIRNTAMLDGPDCEQVVEQEPGSGGKESAQNTVRNLAGFTVMVDKVIGDKLTRANPYAAQCYVGNVRVLVGPWTDAYIDELHNFDPHTSCFKDQVDASSGAFNKLTAGGELILRCGGQVVGLPEKHGPEDSLVRTLIRQQGVYWPGGRPT